MEKGENDLYALIGSIIDSLKNNSTMNAIKGHQYITVSNPVCYMNINIMGHSRQISFCEYEEALRRMGHILFGIISLIGFIHVIKS